MKLYAQCQRCKHVRFKRNRFKGNPCSKGLYAVQNDSWQCGGFEKISQAHQTLLTYAMLGANHRRIMGSQQKETSQGEC